MVDVAAVVAAPEADSSEKVGPDPTLKIAPSDTDISAGRRRFITAIAIGAAAVTIPYLWTLWALWSGSPDPLRGVPYDNFYDLQARAMFQGRLNIPNGYMGIEAFLHNGRQYTYFGVFPSILRMPILMLTHRFDGKLTAPSMLLAWVATGVFSSLLFWRLRIIIRGRAIMGRAEAVAFGVLTATIMGGSVMLYLAATPFIYSEDFAWSVPLTVGALFALLGVLEQPSWGRVLASGLVILAVSLNRTPAGYGCTIGALLIGAWFAFGTDKSTRRRWALPLLAVAIVPFLANSAVTYAKFGIPVGLPMADQVWAHVNAHRRNFLAANGGKAFSPQFLPSTLLAYFQPFDLHVASIFPFVTPPTAPARVVGGAVLDQTYPTASMPATMPLLFLLSCWGTITAFRPKGFGQIGLTRIILVTAAAGSAGVLLWGYISERYLADFMPFLIVAGGIGLIDIWRRLDLRPIRAKWITLGVISLLGAFCVMANVAIAISPVAQWTQAQTVNYVNAQQRFSMGSLAGTVRHGETLPYWAPSGQVFDVGSCSGLYLSTGNQMKDVPGQQIQHYTWIPVERSPDMTHVIGFTFNGPASGLTSPVPLLTYGASSLIMEPAEPGYVQFRLVNSGTSIPWPSNTGWHIPIKYLHHQYKMTVITDPNMNQMLVTWYGSKLIGHYLGGAGPAQVAVTAAATPHALVSVAQLPTPASPVGICRSLTRGS
jgi:hypothetical protein